MQVYQFDSIKIESFFKQNMTHFLYPGPEVWGALIEASVLDKMLLALGAHGTAVIPVKVIQIRVVLLSFCTGVGCAACIVLPRRTLQSRKLHGNVTFQFSKTIS